MGLVVSKEGGRGYSMLYGMEHGWIQWAPGWVKGLICRVWNRTNCTFFGHDLTEVDAFKTHSWPGAPGCLNCMEPLLVDGKYPTPEEVAENDRIVYEEWDKPIPEDFEDPETPQ